MARFARKGLMSALEEAEVVDQVPAQDAGDVEEHLTEVIENEIELQEEATSLEMLHLHLEEAVEEVSDGEELVDTIEEVASDENGEEEGLTEEEAVIAEESLRRIYRRLGIEHDKVLPSMESFRSTSSRKMATRLAIEETRSKLKEVWERIIEAIRGLFKRIKAFFDRIVDGTVAMKKATQALMYKLEAALSRFKKPALEFEDERIAKQLPGKAPYSEEHFRKMLDAHLAQNELTLKHAPSVASSVNALIEQKELTEEAFKAAVMETAKNVGLMVAGTPVTESQREVESKNVLYNKMVPKAELEVEGSRYRLHATFGAEEMEQGEPKVVVRNVRHLKDLGKVCDALADATVKSRDLVNAIEKEFNSVTGKIKQLVSGGEGDELPTEVKAFFPGVYNNTLSYASQLNMLHARAIRFTQGFVSQCIKEMEGEKETEAQPA